MSRSGAGLFGSHVPGASAVHRAPLLVKFLIVLAVGSTTVLLSAWWQALVVLLAMVTIHLSAGLGPRRLGRSLRPVAPLLVVLLGFQWLSSDLPTAVRIVLGIAACYLAAGVLTATTSPTTMIDGVVRGARPVRRWIDPEVVALGVAVMFRSVPWIAGTYAEVRESAQARGLERNPRAIVLPVVIHTVGYARATGEALLARGLGDPDPGTRPPAAPPTNGGAAR